MGSPQTSYSLDPGAALPGQLADSGPGLQVDCAVAAEAIPAGCVVEMDSNDQLVLPKQGVTSGKKVGVSLMQDTLVSSTTYAIGDMVPFVRKGRVYANFNGGSQSTYGTAQVKAAADDVSGNAQYRGFLTGSASGSTAHAEIDAGPEGIKFGKTCSTSGLCIADVNLPA